MALIYLDTGEIFLADDDGLPLDDSLVAVLATPEYALSGQEEMDRLGNLFAAAPELAAAATDALAGWRYIRTVHGDLSGVGWDRVEQALSAALSRLTPSKE